MFIDVDIMISGQVKTRIDYLPYTLFHDFFKSIQQGQTQTDN